MPNTPYMPGAYNYWQGNRFVIPPLGQYARPVYADVLAPLASNDPALAAAMPQAVDPRIADHAMMRDGGFQGGMPSSAPGVGMNAQVDNFGDFARAALTGPVTALGSLGVQAVANALSGNPSRSISGLGLSDAAQAVRDAIAGPPPTSVGPYSPDQTFADPVGDYDSGAYGDAAQEAAEKGGYEGSGMYAHGGVVNKLMGPNPPGPDDGFAGLDRGEFVVRAKEARKHRGLLEQINKGKLNKKKARGLLD